MIRENKIFRRIKLAFALVSVDKHELYFHFFGDDIFYVNGEYYISEVNPRFGGGYPHAYECGCNHMELILNNLQGKINESKVGFYEEDIYMMKYNEVAIRKV